VTRAPQETAPDPLRSETVRPSTTIRHVTLPLPELREVTLIDDSDRTTLERRETLPFCELSVTTL
jgi:hypothetical protein